MNYQLPVPTQKAVYEWSYDLGVNANKVGAEIEEIAEEKNGEVVPRDLVEKAKRQKSEMHDLFEWDDESAAEKYRDNQAGYILRNLKIRIVGALPNDSKKEFLIRSMINVKVEEKQFYSPLTVVLGNEKQREYAIKDLSNSLMSWRRKSAVFAEFSAIHAVIDRVLVDAVDMPEMFDEVEQQ